MVLSAAHSRCATRRAAGALQAERREAEARAHLDETPEETARRALEWGKLAAQLAPFARTPMGERAALEARVPAATELAGARALMRETASARDVLAADPKALDALSRAFPIGGALRACERCAESAMLEEGTQEGSAEGDDLPAPPAGEQLWAVAETASAALETLAALPDESALRQFERMGCEELLDDAGGSGGGGGGGASALAAAASAVHAAVRDSRGALKLDASEALAALRSEERSLDTEVDALLRALHAELAPLSATPGRAAEVVLRRGRACLAVREDRRGAVLPDAAVLAMSSSGATAFVETAEATAINNALERVRAEIYAEEMRVLRELGTLVHACAPAARAAQRWIELCDLAQARARHAEWVGAIEPMLVDPANAEEALRLERMRHPLMLAAALPPPGTPSARARAATSGSGSDTSASEPAAGADEAASDSPDTASSSALPQPPVPFDMELSSDVSAVVISGPNAGGKTACLKAVGVAALMARSGMFVPAAAARVPVWPAVLAVIGDAQSLGENLSTFSGQLARYKAAEAYAARVPASLLLCDELGSGTDPVEGAALAYALLRRRASGVSTSGGDAAGERTPGPGRSGSLAVATTHFDRLRMLSTEPELQGRIASAAVEFDYAELRPTYKLLWGGAGASNAIAVAAALGVLPDDAAERRAEALYAPLRAELDEERALADAAEEAAAAAAAARDAARADADAAERARDESASNADSTRESAEYALEEGMASLEELIEAMKDVTAAKASAWQDEGNAEVDRVLEEFRSSAPDGALFASDEFAAEVGQLFPKEFGIERTIMGEILLEKADPDAVLARGGGAGLSRKQRRALQNAARDGNAASMRKMSGAITAVRRGKGERTQSTPGAFGNEQRSGSGDGFDMGVGETELKLDARTTRNTLMLAGSGLYPSDAADEIDRWLNDVATSGGSTLFINHGQGSGKMRQAVHAKLQKTSWIKQYWLQEDHAGITIVTF
eukprot:PRCOL_00005616-RA